MTTFRNRVVFACLSMAGTAGLVSFSNPAAVPVGEARRAPVAVAGLDLAAPADRATVARRGAGIADAANA